jgi:hypothetical protein
MLTAHQGGIALDALGHEFRVLDKIGGRVNDARDDAFALRQFHLFKDIPFVLMAGVGALESDRRT